MIDDNRMSPNALASLNFDATTRKRAQWESFEFSVPTEGTVAVANASYGDEKDDHTHAVNVEDGVPTSCSCKADEYQPGACKHRVAVAITGPVLEAASADRTAGKRALADGGTIATPNPEGSEPETTHAPGCDNPECEGFDADGRPLLSFPCWERWAGQ